MNKNPPRSPDRVRLTTPVSPRHETPQRSRALSSAGERSLHTGEVVGSIPTAPTRKLQQKQDITGRPLPFLPIFTGEQAVNSPSKLGENVGSLFDSCSARNRGSTRWRPPPKPENESPGAVGTATGVEDQSVLERTTQPYLKPDSNVQSAGALGIERSAVSRGRYPHVRRRYNPQQAVARPLTRSNRASLCRCDRNIRRLAARLRAAELLVAIPFSDCRRSNGHVSILDGGPQFEVALTSEQLCDDITGPRPDGDSAGTLEPHRNTAETEATTPTSEMVAPLIAVAARAERGAAP